MRAISELQASRCEMSASKICRCRCGGRLHGANRADVHGIEDPPPGFFEQLAEDDPHRVLSDKEKKERVKMRRAAVRIRASAQLSLFEGD